MEAIKAICDGGCKKEFIVQEFLTAHVKGDIEKYFFTCPHCGKEYLIYYTNSKIRRLQQQQQKTRDKPLSDRRFMSMRDHIKAEMDALKERVEGQ